MSDRSLILRGRVVAVLGTNVDTDMLYPGRYLNITDREKTAEHLFELAYPALRAQIADLKASNPWIVAGKNFGCGSSREQAEAALKFAGVAGVIAGSFARIFYRNSINLGLPAVLSEDACLNCAASDELEIDLQQGRVRNLTRNLDITAAALDARAVELLAAGGLIPYLKRKYAA